MFLLCSIVILLSSCATTSFYQVYNVKPIEESILNADEFLFEDENCKISYNLWARGGDSGFEFYNKTENNIYVKLNESNFILNGFAYDYFKNRTFTTSESKSVSAANTSTGSVADDSVGQSRTVPSPVYVPPPASIECVASAVARHWQHHHHRDYHRVCLSLAARSVELRFVPHQ